MSRPPFETFTKPTCRGSYAFNSACGHCERCAWEREQMGALGSSQSLGSAQRSGLTPAERDLLLSIGEALTAVLERDSHLITWDRRGMAMSWGAMCCVLESRMKAVKAEWGAEQQ